jgi:hypothetical protein
MRFSGYSKAIKNGAENRAISKITNQHYCGFGWTKWETMSQWPSMFS